MKGRTHELTLLKVSALLTRLPAGIGCLGDLAYQGIRDLHPLGACPRKKAGAKISRVHLKTSLTTMPFLSIVVENTLNRLRRK